MANDYLPVKRRIYFANNSSRNSIVDGAAAALAQKRLPSSQRIHLQVFLGRPKIASDIGHMPEIYILHSCTLAPKSSKIDAWVDLMSEL